MYGPRISGTMYHKVGALAEESGAEDTFINATVIINFDRQMVPMKRRGYSAY